PKDRPARRAAGSHPHRRLGFSRPGRTETMRMAITAAGLGILALLGVAGSPMGRATDIDDYRWDHGRPDCRVVETRTTNRCGDDLTARRRICGLCPDSEVRKHLPRVLSELRNRKGH